MDCLAKRDRFVVTGRIDFVGSKPVAGFCNPVLQPILIADPFDVAMPAFAERCDEIKRRGSGCKAERQIFVSRGLQVVFHIGTSITG